MALLRGPYLEHVLAALRHALVRFPGAIALLVAGLVHFVANGPDTIGGTPTTLANRRETVRILLGVIWKNVLNRPYHGHLMRHWLVEAGVPEAALEEPPDAEEPTL